MTRPRAVFFGTPEFAVPTLESLLDVADVVRVITQPDRRSGRGMKLTPPPVKVLARERGVDVQQPTKVRTADFAESLRVLDLDVAVVVAYGRILPKRVLEVPRLGCVNVHASLLPRWRGAAPIQWAIVHGDTETGVCLMQMDEGMDTGPVLSVADTPIGPDETAGDLAARLSRMGADLLRRDLPRFVAGEIAPTPQDDAAATMAPLLTKEDGRLDFDEPAARIHDRVRGMHPWPGAHTTLDGAMLKVHRTRVANGPPGGAPGEVVDAGPDGIVVACGAGRLVILELQTKGKRRMDAESYLKGHPIATGATLS